MEPDFNRLKEAMRRVVDSSRVEHHSHGSEYDSFKEHMKRYFKDIKEDRLEAPAEIYEMIMTCARMCGGEYCHDDVRHEDEHEEHKRWKDAIEQLREAGPNDKHRMIKELFVDDLTSDELIVLRALAEMKPTKRWALEKGLSEERWHKAKAELKHKRRK